jgi:hypothetical protein
MRAVCWRSIEQTGLERLVLDEQPGRIVADGIVIGSRGGSRYGLHYKIECDEQWRTREIWVQVQSGPILHLFGNGSGEWRNAANGELPELTGCIDVDLAATPFTNTLPIRRLGLSQGERRAIQVVYIPVPSLVPAPAEQAYTCLEPGGRFLYEGIFRKFRAELSTDQDGLVLDYPSLFAREDG